MASSRWFAGRSRIRSISIASSSVRPRARWIGGAMPLTVQAGHGGPGHCLDLRIPIGQNVCMASKARRKTHMSDDHKAALAVGRTEGRVVRRYLDALEANKPKRGRKRTPDSIQRRLKAI